MHGLTNPWKMTDLVPKGGSVVTPDFTVDKIAFMRPVTTFTVYDYNYEIARAANGKITALFHRNLKTGEATT